MVLCSWRRGLCVSGIMYVCVHGGQCCRSGHYTILWACLRMKPRSVQSPDLNSAQPILVPRRGQADITSTQGHTNRRTRTQTSLTKNNANVLICCSYAYDTMFLNVAFDR